MEEIFKKAEKRIEKKNYNHGVDKKGNKFMIFDLSLQDNKEKIFSLSFTDFEICEKEKRCVFCFEDLGVAKNLEEIYLCRKCLDILEENYCKKCNVQFLNDKAYVEHCQDKYDHETFLYNIFINKELDYNFENYRITGKDFKESYYEGDECTTCDFCDCRLEYWYTDIAYRETYIGYGYENIKLCKDCTNF